MFYVYIVALLLFYLISKITNKQKCSLPIGLIGLYLFYTYIKNGYKLSNTESFTDSSNTLKQGDYIEFNKVEYEGLEDYGYFGSVENVLLAGTNKLSNRNTLWRLNGTGESDSVIKNGDTISLVSEHHKTRKIPKQVRKSHKQVRKSHKSLKQVHGGNYLSSSQGPSTLMSDSYEVSLSNVDDNNSKWILEVEGEGEFSSSSKFRLRHKESGYYLYITNKLTSDDAGLGVVLVSQSYIDNAGLGDKLWYSLNLTERNSNRALRLYDQFNWEINGLIKYHISRTDKADREELNFISRKGYNELRSCFVPEGRELLFYRETRNREYFTRLGPGWYDNLDMGKIGSLVYQMNCGAKFYSRNNYRGEVICLLSGLHKLKFKPQSWMISPDFNIKLFSLKNEVLITDEENSGLREVAQASSLGKKFSNIDEVNISHKGVNNYLTELGKSPEIEATHRNYFVSKNPKIPAIKQTNLKCFLDATNKDSYSGGKNWMDISGNNNHFVWLGSVNHRFSYGKLLLKKSMAIGPSAKRFDLGDGTNGYTMVFYAELVKQNEASMLPSGFSFLVNKFAIKTQIPANDNIVYFDNENSNDGRLSYRLPDKGYSNKMRVITMRRSSNKNGGLMSIFIDGKEVKKGQIVQPKFDLNKNANAVLYGSYNGNVQSFMLYNTDLSNTEIGKLTELIKGNHKNYLVKIDQEAEKILRTKVPDYPISNSGLRCMLDAKFANKGDDNWKDLSGNNNNFKFDKVPTLLGGKFIKVSKLTGPSADSIGINNGSHGYTVLVLSRCRGGEGLIKINNIELRQDGSSKLIKFNHSGCCKENFQQVQGNAGDDFKRMNVIAYRKTGGIDLLDDKSLFKSEDSSKLGIFMNGRILNEGLGQAYWTLLEKELITMDFSSWDGEIGGFLVYSRALSNNEIRLLSDWLRRPNYGSNKKLTGEIDGRPEIKSGLCVGMGDFDNTDCFSFDNKTKLVDSDGKGFCYTDKASKKIGYCTSDVKRTDIDDKYNVKNSKSWDDAKTYCENRGGRLCYVDELTIGGSGYLPRTGFDNLSSSACESIGGIYNEDGNYCGTKSSKGNDRMISARGYLWSPVEDAENEWIFVGTKDKAGVNRPDWIGKTYKQIFGKNPEWGLNYQNKDYKKATICCGIKSLSRCDKLKLWEKNYTRRINNESDEGLKERLILKKKQYTDEYNRDCRKETYYDVFDRLKKYKEQYNTILKELSNTRTDKEELIRNLMELKSYVDQNDEKHIDKVMNSYDESGNPVYKTYGKIPNLVRQIVSIRESIKAEKERQKNCPKDMDCKEQVVKEREDKVHQLKVDSDCRVDDLRNALLDKRLMNEKSYEELKNILSTENVIKQLDIKNHRDYYKYVEKNKVKSCENLGKLDKLKNDIKDHPDYSNYMHINSVPYDRLPYDKKVLLDKNNK